ncbi:MAG TPA: ATP-dependent DNA helicase [Nitrososphaerales archaeon]|nr:ATP-dependent DNA helicase [Nitrososphaerales archaeon]
MEIEEAFAYSSFRPGQRELAHQVRQSCASGGILMAEAMSGFGKTAAVLAGAISAAEETGCRIVYTCRTKRQILRVIEELSRLQSKHPVAAAPMLSKFDYCLLKEGSPRPLAQQSFGWYCWFNVHNNLCSYFLNAGLLGAEFQQAVREALAEVPSHQDLLRKSRSIHVCPYEVERLAIAQAKLAIVPYHYVFDPGSAPVLFDRNSIERERTMLIVDEAHNLRDFLRGVNSATLTMEELDGAAREARGLFMERAAMSLGDLGGTLRKVMEGTPGWRLDRAGVLEEFRETRGSAWLQNLSYELTACSEAAWGAVAYERRLPSLLLKVGEFLVRLSSSTRGVLVKWERTLALIDPDPVSDLAQYLGRFRSTVLVSATMNPSAVFARSLGLGAAATATYHVMAEPAVSVMTVIETGVTTKYKSRSPQMYAKIAEKVASVIRATESGVGVFTPSYAVLEPICEMVTRRVEGKLVLAESRGLSNQDAAALFDSLRLHRGSVLFAVQGGRFSEGEDFREDLMGAVVVVGLSLPPPSPMLYAEYACLKRTGEPDSFLMLSRLPALRKAFQAAGRHIRNPGKRGLVFLMDHRFDSEAVRELMPSWMKKDLVSGDFTPEKLGRLTYDFWGSR